MEVDSRISLPVCLAQVSFTAEQALHLPEWHLDRLASCQPSCQGEAYASWPTIDPSKVW